MKCAGTFLIAATLAVAAGARAQAVAAPASPPAAGQATDDKPYSTIVARNMFQLVPIPVHKPEDDLPPPEPPPKITPNGIMTIFGKLQALFKVASKGKPGQPPKDESYVLTEGERQNDIEVVKINQPDGIITFNNHGTIQELPLVAAKDTGSAPEPGRPGGAGSGINPGMRRGH